MHVFEASLSGLVEWCIHKSDPLDIPLDSLPGCFLINPLFYPELANDHNRSPYWMEAWHNDAVVLKTNAMFLATQQSLYFAGGQFDFAYFPDFLSSLRLVTDALPVALPQHPSFVGDRQSSLALPMQEDGSFPTAAHRSLKHSGGSQHKLLAKATMLGTLSGLQGGWECTRQRDLSGQAVGTCA